MAKQAAFPSLLYVMFLSRFPGHSNVLRSLLLLSAFLLSAISAQAQFQQPLVFSSGGGIAVRNDQTGALTPVSGSPFLATNQQLTIDVQGRFLFGIGVNSIHLYQITDTTTGAYAEVPSSPFSSPNTNQPLFVAVEPSGKYIAVINHNGRNPGESSVETFQIDAAHLALVPVAGSFIELDSTPVFPVGVAQPPNDKKFYVYMGPNPLSSNTFIQNGEELAAISIDPLSGFLQGIQNNPDTSTGRCFAMDPQGRYIVKGHGNLSGLIDLMGIDGVFPGATISLGLNTFPKALFVDSTGTFLYATYSSGQTPATVVHIYSVNLQTGATSETTSSPLPNFTAVPSFGSDPTGPFEYSPGPQTGQVQGFTVDPKTGYFVAISGSPFTVPGLDSFFFSIPPGQQPLSGPSASLSATSLSFGSIPTGSSSPPQVVALTSNGGQALSINSIAIAGANASEFNETDTCQVPTVLQPGKFCSISVTFTPSATGSQQANVTITDNAAGSPQLISLTGAGVVPPPPAPAVTITPNPVSFPTISQGTTSGPITITVTNSGTATLNISLVKVGGNNPADFITTNNCSGAIAVKSTCTISVTFAPLAAGQRTETITLTDDAPDSPQVINVSGNANPTLAPVTVAPNPVSFSGITQGTASSLTTVTVTNSGTTTLHISSVNIGGNNPIDFITTSNCNGAIAVNSTCTVSVTFAPLAVGQRTETIMLTDDASNSPQVISVGGTANPVFSVAPAPGGSTSASITAGQTAQYQLQFTAGPGYTGNVSLSCSGAPLAATCQVPAGVALTSTAPAPFTVTVLTSGSGVVPPSNPMRFPPFSGLRLFPLLALAYVLWIARRNLRTFENATCKTRWTLSCAFTAAVLCGFLSVGGCGGGSATVAPPPSPPPAVVTPSGTFTIVVTPTAMSLAGKPLQLQPIQLTLTVK